MPFIIYRSSAGSGKTFTLTKTYLKLALSAPRKNYEASSSYFKHILAITFTNDAAQEMKHRIVGMLAEMASGKPNDAAKQMLDAIVSELNEETGKEWDASGLMARAKLLHQRILHEYYDFSVSTIDSFSSRVVQSFKKDLGLPFTFELHLDTEPLAEDVVMRMLRDVRADEPSPLSELLQRLANQRSDDGRNWFIRQDLERYAQMLFSDQFEPAIAAFEKMPIKWFLEELVDINKFIQETENAAIQHASRAMTLLQQENIEAASCFQSQRGFYGRFEGLANQSLTIADINTESSYLTKPLLDNKWAGNTKNKAQLAAIERIAPQLHEALSYIMGAKEHWLLAKLLQQSVVMMATLSGMKVHWNQIQHDQHIVHISEYNKRINSIVESEPVPYIYERIGDRYFHILIDEFQDTSQMQWHNLIPLVSNCLAYNGDCLIVGDAKQAIYRWRGGDASLIVNLPHVPSVAQDSPLLEHLDPLLDARSIVLGTNYRSGEEIVNFNNQLFEALKTEYADACPELSHFYQEVVQQHKKPHGYIEMCLVEEKPRKKSKPEDGDEGDEAESTGADSKEYNTLALQQTEALIEQALSDGYQYGDIAIIVRENDNAKVMAEHLTSLHIPIATSDSLLVGNAKTVCFLADWLLLFFQPQEKSAKGRICTFLDKHAEELFYSLGAGIQVFKEKEAQNTLTGFCNAIEARYGISIPLEELRMKGMYDLIEDLLALFGLQKIVHERPYLHSFLNYVMDFSMKIGGDWPRFLDDWDYKRTKLAIPLSGARNAVRILTIHKSKGLQFPIVLMPFTTWDMGVKNRNVVFDWSVSCPFMKNLSKVLLPLKKDLEKLGGVFSERYTEEKRAAFLEQLNMLYVALTRAEHRLYIIGKDKKPSKNAALPSNASVLLDTARELFENTEKATISLAGQEDASINIAIYRKGTALRKEEFVPAKTAETSENSEILFVESRYHSIEGRLLLKGEQSAGRMRQRELVIVEEARKKGIKMHSLLERVAYTSDIPKAVHLGVREGLIEAEQAAEMQQAIEQLLANPAIATYYRPKAGMRVLNEQEILLDPMREGLGKSLRPDRLIIDGQKAVVIDYKTGAQLESHKKQLRKYGQALKELGYSAQLYLLYLERQEVVEVA